MRKIYLGALCSLLLFLFGCQASNHANNECNDPYNKQSERNGGNGGFVDPKTFCKDKSQSSIEKGEEYIISFDNEIKTDVILKEGAVIKETLKPLNAVVTVLTKEQVEILKKEPSIKYIEKNHVVKML